MHDKIDLLELKYVRDQIYLWAPIPILDDSVFDSYQILQHHIEAILLVDLDQE